MEQMTLVVAGIAALAILLIAFGLASSRRQLGHRDAPRALRFRQAGQGQGGVDRAGPISDLLAQSQALASLNKVVEQRDFGANLARDLARADLKLKPSEFLLIWAASIVGVPLVMLLLVGRLPGPEQPARC